MPRGNNSSTQQELTNRLRKVQTLVSNCLDLIAQTRQKSNRPLKPKEQTKRSDFSFHFEMNERAFMNRYAKNLSSGQKKFVLVLAYLAKGDNSKDIPLSEIEALWNKMKSKTLLGMKFNRFFPTTAKDHGWVDSKKRGFYNLDRPWKEIFADD